MVASPGTRLFRPTFFVPSGCVPWLGILRLRTSEAAISSPATSENSDGGGLPRFRLTAISYAYGMVWYNHHSMTLVFVGIPPFAVPYLCAAPDSTAPFWTMLAMKKRGFGLRFPLKKIGKAVISNGWLYDSQITRRKYIW